MKVRLISEDEVRLEGHNVGSFFQFNFSEGDETPASVRYRKGGVLIEAKRPKPAKKPQPKKRAVTINSSALLMNQGD